MGEKATGCTWLAAFLSDKPISYMPQLRFRWWGLGAKKQLRLPVSMMLTGCGVRVIGKRLGVGGRRLNW